MPRNGYFDTVFAVDGDLTAVPDATQGNGTVSYQQGFPVGYSTPVASGGFNFPRYQHNQILNDITTAIQNQQQNCYPPFITTAMNGGTPYSYSKFNTCYYEGIAYISLANANTTTPPGADWAIVPLGGNNFWGGTSTGSANAQVISTGLALTALSVNQSFSFIAGYTSTSSPVTLAIDSVAPIDIYANSGTGLTEIGVSGLIVGNLYTAKWDGTNLVVNTTSSERTRLIGAQTFYVNAASGSDANNGLTSGTAWQTISHALLAVAANYDLNNQSVTIQLADGTYTNAGQGLPWVGGAASNVTINGDGVTPSNVVAQGLVANNPGCGFMVTNMEIANPSGAGLSAGLDAQIYTGAGVVFGACSTDHVNAQNGGNVILSSAYTIAGSAGAHFNAGISGTITLADVAITVTGTPAFGAAFAVANACGGIFVNSGATFTGSATGSRYSATVNGWIDTQGAGATYFPGGTSGTTATGGQYA